MHNKKEITRKGKQNKTKQKDEKIKGAISYSDLNSRLQLNKNIIYWRTLKCGDRNPF